MSKAKLSPSQAISTGWETVKKNITIFIIAAIAVVVLPGIVEGIIGRDNMFSSLATFLLNAALLLGFAHMAFGSLSQKKIDLNMFTEKLDRYADMVIAMFLVGLAIMVGFIFLIIPGIYLLLRLQFFVYFIAEKKLGAIDAIKASYKLTEGRVMDLLSLFILQMAVMVLGVIAFFVGIFVAYPVVVVSQAYAFKKLSGK